MICITKEQRRSMAEEGKERWLNFVALTTVVLAVCATLATFNGAKYSTRSILSQTQAANAWAYYQSKSIKGYIYENQLESIELEMKKSKLPPTVAQAYEKRLDSYRQKIKKYDEEKADISREAKRLETVRDEAQRHSGIFGIAVIFLQIAILLCSISALMKKKYLWILGSCTGVVGVVYFLNGFFLFL